MVNRRRPSRQSILLAAKKECDLLRNFEKRMIMEKEKWHSINKDLKMKIAKAKRTTDYCA